MAKPDATTAAPAATSTRQANTASGIDFSAGRDGATFTESAGRKSVWVDKVKALVEGVKAGNGKAGTFYPLGSFVAASGARTTIRNLAKQTDKLPKTPVTFKVESTTNDDGISGCRGQCRSRRNRGPLCR